MEIIKDALAGTLESSDVMVRIGPCDEPEYTELESLVKQQFGNAIERVTRETLAKLGVERAHVVIDDKGALECVLRARVQAAVMRAAEQAEIQWGQYETTSQYVVYPGCKCRHVKYFLRLWRRCRHVRSGRCCFSA